MSACTHVNGQSCRSSFSKALIRSASEMSGVGGGGDSPLHAIAEDDSRLDSTAGFLFDGSAALDAEACMALLQSFFNAADVDGENTVTVH